MALTKRYDVLNNTANGNACYLCGSPQRILAGTPEPMIDTGLSIDWEGFLIFCSHCVVEMGHLLGMSTDLESDALKLENSELRTELDEVREKLSASEEFVSSFQHYKDVMETPEGVIVNSELQGE